MVHAGYGHIAEKIFGSYPPMGANLSKLFESDPLTIDQTKILEYLNTKNRFYEEIINYFNIKQSTVLKKQNKIWSISSKYDLTVIHPKMETTKGRLNWLIYDDKQLVALPRKLKKYNNYLVSVYPVGEVPNAIPVDRFEIAKDKHHMIIEKGSYNLKIQDRYGKVVEELVFKH